MVRMAAGRPWSRRLRRPPGMPRRDWDRFLLVLAVVALVATLVVRFVGVRDAAGRPAWRVDRIHDGDTVSCRDESDAIRKIRLVGIDAPELDQPFGRESRAALVTLLAGGVVRVESHGIDKHGRLLGRLFVADDDVNLALVDAGWAWSFGGFAGDAELEAAEERARAARLGLWAGNDPIRPSRWRDLHPSRP